MTKHSIKLHVWARVAAVLFAALLMGVVVNISIRFIRTAEQSNEQANTMLSQAQAAQTAHHLWYSQLGDSLYTGTAFAGTMDPTACGLGQWLYGDAGTQDPDILALREELIPLHETIHASAQEALDLPQAQGQVYYRQTIQNSVTTLVGMLDEIVTRADAVRTENEADMGQAIQIASISSIVCGLLTFLCLGSLVQYVLRCVIKPILHITEESRVLLEGRLDFHLDCRVKNELGELAQILQQSMGTIRGYVAEIDRLMAEYAEGRFAAEPQVDFQGDFHSIQKSMDAFTSRISQALDVVETAAAQVSSGADQISGSSQSLAQGATEQASSVETLVTELKELAQISRENAERAQTVQGTARQSGERAEESSRQMGETVQAMSEIQKSASEISRIIGTIEDIAFQTNILALNAAVEAARAGAAGKGFAVVADEVRTLAGKTAGASQNTAELIERAMAAVKNGKQIADDTAASFRSVHSGISEVSERTAQVGTETEKQKEALQQTTAGVERISSIVQTSSATAEESAAASQELSSQAHLLRELTGKFILPDQGA